MSDSQKLSRVRWALRDILQFLQSDRTVLRSRVEKAVRCLKDADFADSAALLEAEFQPVFCGRKRTPELLAFVRGLFDSVDAAVSQRMKHEIGSVTALSETQPNATDVNGAPPAPAPKSQPLAAKPSAAGCGDGGDQAYRELGKWAAAELKGKQRRVVELLADNNGKIPIPDLKLACEWEGDQFARCRQHVNNKLRKAGWIIERHDNEARLRQVKSRQK